MNELHKASLPGLRVASSPHLLLSAMVPHPCKDRSAMAATAMNKDGGLLCVMLMFAFPCRSVQSLPVHEKQPGYTQHESGGVCK